MFITAWLVIAPNWKQTPNVLQLVNGYTDCDTSTPRNTTQQEKQMCTITWRNLKCIILNEKCRAFETMYCVIPFVWLSAKGKAICLGNTSVVARGCGEGGVAVYKGAGESIRGWWNCSIFWLWEWLHDYIHLEEVTELYTKKGEVNVGSVSMKNLFV